MCVRIDETGSLVWLRLKRSARVKDVKDGLFTRLGVPSAMQVNTKSKARVAIFAAPLPLTRPCTAVVIVVVSACLLPWRGARQRAQLVGVLGGERRDAVDDNTR